jgi:hypothetical protein
VVSTAIVRVLKVIGILLTIFVLEILVLICTFLFIGGVLTGQIVGSALSFLIVCACCYLIRCLFRTLMKVLIDGE